MIIQAIIVKIIYGLSFLISLSIIYVISLYGVNLFHFIITIYFVFILLDIPKMFASEGNVNVALTKHWKHLILITQLILFLRYFYALQFESLVNQDIINFIGINYNYETYLTIGLKFGDDFASNTLTWILYLSCIMFYMQTKDMSQ